MSTTRIEAMLRKSLTFKKFIAIQNEFWDTCTLSFVFGMQSFKVDIAQCMIAKNEYIIQKMEAEIVKSVKAELL